MAPIRYDRERKRRKRGEERIDGFRGWKTIEEAEVYKKWSVGSYAAAAVI